MVLVLLGTQFDMGYVWITLVALVLYVTFTVIVTEWRTRFRREMNELESASQTRAIDALGAEAATLGDLKTYGEITIACALGYLDFRFPHEPWRPGHPKLTAWYERVVKLPPMAGTMPVG